MPGGNASTVTFKIRLVASPETRGLALETFRSLVGQIRGEPGCLNCQLLEDVHEPGDLTFTAKWRSQQVLERYVHSTGFRRLLAGIELAASEPEVEIQTTAGVRGFEFFEALLNPTVGQ